MPRLKFIQSASDFHQFPDSQLKQVAIAGRSNSGKSSFINSLGRNRIAKVSSTPGKTRLLNIFEVDEAFWLVDMPGYGYAARSHKERGQWESMIEAYLQESEHLSGLILLMDVRRAWSEDESMLIDFATAHDLPVVIGLTKADKLSRSRWLQVKKQLEAQLGVSCFVTSSLKRWGGAELISFVRSHWIDSSPNSAKR